jgi:hypothetical protein
MAAAPECKPTVPGSNLAICLAYSGLPSGIEHHCRLSSEGRQRRINRKKGLWPTKNKKGKKEKMVPNMVKRRNGLWSKNKRFRAKKVVVFILTFLKSV